MLRYLTTFRIGPLAATIGLGLLGGILSAQSPAQSQAQSPSPAPSPPVKPPAQASAPRPTGAASKPPAPTSTSAAAIAPLTPLPAAVAVPGNAVPGAAIPGSALSGSALSGSALSGSALSGSTASTGSAPAPGVTPATPTTTTPTTAADPPQVPGTPPFLAGITVDHPDGVYRQGELLSLQCQAERDAYLYVLYRQANGETALIFPNGLQPIHRVQAKTPVVLPPAGDVVYRVQPPLGDERLQVLAVEKRLPELDGLVREKSRAVVVPQTVLAALHRRLEQHRDAWTEHHVAIRSVPSRAQPPRPPKRVGLFIGLAEYADAEICKPHAELGNSATVMHELMVRLGKLDPQATRLLRDKQATKEEIRKSITDWLPAVSQPGDAVFIYYSGRAARYATTDPSETDGYDEALIPYDMSIGGPNATLDERVKIAREHGIIDDELAYWLQSLGGRQVVLILDTCHGGGVVEGKSLAAGFEAESQRVKDISQMNVAVLTSCAADEQSRFEGGPNNTLWFTHCLADVIERRPDGGPLLLADGYRLARQRMRDLLPQGSPALDQEPTFVDRTLLPIELIP